MFDSKECEWADLTLYLNGAKVVKIQGLRARRSQEKEFLYAAGNEPGDIQSGNKGGDGTLTLLKGAADNIRRAIAAAGGIDIMDARFVIVADFAPKGNRIAQSNTYNGVEFTEDPLDLVQNQNSIPIPIPFLFLQKIST